MGIDERSRHELFLKLEDVLGPDEAATLMEHLPPTGWADVARKSDLDQLAAATKRDITQLAADNQREHEQLAATFRREHEQLAATFRRDHEQLAAAFQREHEQLGTSLRKDMELLEQRVLATVRGEMSIQLQAQTRTLMLAMMGAVVSVGGLVFAVARLA